MKKTTYYCDICENEIEDYEMKSINVGDINNNWTIDFCLSCWSKVDNYNSFLKALKRGIKAEEAEDSWKI